MNDVLDLNKTGNVPEEIKEAPADGGGSAQVSEVPVFLSSLSDFTEKDIDLNETAKAEKKPPIDFARYFILLVCLAVFAFAGYSIVNQLFEYAEAANDTDLLREMFYGREDALSQMQELRRARITRPIQDILSLQRQTVREIGVIVSEGVAVADQMRAQLDGMFANIQNMYAWIKVSHTNVDYPVVQWTDNDYYLRRNVYGFAQTSGSIYTDFRNDKNVDKNLNTIIYGHNMANGTFFSSLMNLDKHEDSFNDAIIELTTPDGIYYYEVFSVHVANPMFYYRETWFESGERYVEWLYEMKERSKFQKDIIFTPQSRIITLSTCTNWMARGNPRLAVHGVLIDVLRYSN